MTAAGYTRQSAGTIITGAVILASGLNAEYNQLSSAFSGGSGHDHSGGTGLGPQLSLTTAITGILPAANGGTGIANSSNITIGGALTFSGAFSTTFTVTNTTTVTLPLTGTLSTLAGSEVLTNKTLTAPVISTISNTGTLTLPTSTDTLVGRATSDTLTNKTLTAPVISTISNTGTLTLPTSTDTLVGRATSDTLTNKTLTSPVISGGNIDNTVIGLTTQASGAFTTVSVNSALAPSNGFNLPASNTIAINSLSNAVARFVNAASCVNYFSFAGGITGTPGVITLSAGGTDSNISIVNSTKGTGQYSVTTNGKTGFVVADGGASAVNWISVAGSNTGVKPGISAQGEASVGLAVYTAGTGNIVVSTNNTTGTSLTLAAVASAANGLTITSATTANPSTVTLSGTGSDSNINVAISAKGSGVVQISPVLTTTYGGTGVAASNPIIQRVSTETGAVNTGTTTVPFDDTIPQNTEGDQYMTLAITPKNSGNILVIDVSCTLTNTNQQELTIGLFQDTTANALAANFLTAAGNTFGGPVTLRHIMSAGTTSATTFKVRAGGNGAGTTTFNGQSGGRIFGGVMVSSIMITEYAS